jgi:hypothetical protein
MEISTFDGCKSAYHEQLAFMKVLFCVCIREAKSAYHEQLVFNLGARTKGMRRITKNSIISSKDVKQGKAENLVKRNGGATW